MRLVICAKRGARRKLDAVMTGAQQMAMPTKEPIDTSHGKVWLTHFDNGDVSIWTPPRSRQADLVADTVNGRAAWKPKYKAWIAPAVHAQQIIEELQDV